MAQYTVQQVVATGCTDALVAFRLPLPTPAWEVTAIQKTVLLDRAEATLGSVLLQGRLRACYTLATAPEGSRPPPIGTPLPPGAEISLMQTPLRALWAEVPFCLALPLPEAEPDQQTTLTAAHVTTQVVDVAQWNDRSLIIALNDQSMLHLAVRLTRTRDLQPMAETPPPAPDVTPRPGRKRSKPLAPAPASPARRPIKTTFTDCTTRPKR